MQPTMPSTPYLLSEQLSTVLSYGSETWTMTAKSAELLDSLERRMLRRIYGPVNSKGIWRIRWNHEIYELYKEH
ncbi:hypothetical protein J437_LFUL003432 [Ladona fulva]|uniref:Uncharacterized protein n=1 Tax=Ladona fulva TaxID=123851 RepID=A0A8K0P113_LADFU|nr:hypothetical protein J437_LFUL003430 [Ladona fulva]KAG8227226.1 hypothetical protein J437_LFUL003432 [Ladona fulva]